MNKISFLCSHYMISISSEFDRGICFFHPLINSFRIKFFLSIIYNRIDVFVKI